MPGSVGCRSIGSRSYGANHGALLSMTRSQVVGVLEKLLSRRLRWNGSRGLS